MDNHFFFFLFVFFFFFSLFHTLIANALMPPFCHRPMPTFSSCDNTEAGDLKRYIVEHKPVMRGSIQTPPV